MGIGHLPEPLDKKVFLPSEGGVDPYQSGSFKAREISWGEVRDIHLIVPRPKLRDRLAHLIWTSLTAIAVVFVVKHYDRIEATFVGFSNSFLKAVGIS